MPTKTPLIVLAWLASSAVVLGVTGQDRAGQDRAGQGPKPLPKQLAAPDPVGTPDGGILFTETDADRIVKIIDSAGRLYAAAQGVQVFSPEGEHLGTIPCGAGPANMVFGGPDKKTLYMVGGGAVYKVQMLAQGLPNRAR